jgi:hypothetical protein
LCNKLGDNLVTLVIDKPVIIDTTDVIHVLNTFKPGGITLNELLEWVNTVGLQSCVVIMMNNLI